MFWTNFLINTLLFFYVLVCVLMGIVILMQRSKQEGLGATFGGSFTESMWGAQTSQVLVKATVWFAALFFILSISLARLYAHRDSMTEKSTIQQQLLQPIPAAKTSTATPSPAPATPAAAAPATATPVPSPAPAVPAAPAK